ncbi:hypothetical protein VTO42DRAFT_6499 [Malbranchea cinnamomea]
MTRSSFLVSCFAGLAVFHGCVLSYEDGHQEVLGQPERVWQSPIRDALLASSIIPDVLDDFTPTFSLLLTWPSSHTSVSLGNNISTLDVKHQPVYQFHPLIPRRPPLPHPPRNHSYVLVLTDPDAKSRKNPKWSEMCHWIVANVTTPEFSTNDNDIGDDNPSLVYGELTAQHSPPKILKSYLAPTPPKGTGFHRYVFVLLEGDEKDSRKLKTPPQRKHWGYHKPRHGVRDWAGENGLRVVGANFFFAQHEADYEK